MVDNTIIEGWLQKADEDFQYAKASLDNNLPFYSSICFHLNQAAEKYLKAYIVAKELEFQKIHDLTKLLQICIANDLEFKKLTAFINEINPFYIETRYPGFTTDFITKSETEGALKMVDEICSFVKTKLS